MPQFPAFSEEPQRLAMNRAPLTVSVVICAYTEDRWPLLLRSVSSVQHQSCVPTEIMVCVDHNDSLLERCRQQWADQADSPSVPVVVLPNRYQGRLGSARNSAAEVARGDIVAFVDDDAWADPDWLDWLLLPYENEFVVAVGGAPMPEFERARPDWFPFEFDWVFGCAYSGLPEKQAPLARLIGANMSVRRLALAEIGGFHSDNHDDMDMCHRLLHLRPAEQIVYEPMALVHHFVPTARTTWAYFWRRCFFVNKGKVEAFRQMEGAAESVIRHRVRRPSAVPGRVQGTATGIPGRPLGSGEGRIHPGRDCSGRGRSRGRTRRVAVESDATGTTVAGVADLPGIRSWAHL